MRVYLLLCFFITSILFSQEEKRLALVIGNSNYDKGELKNPVNDARLIASTLDSLDFDVILKENIETQNDFKLAILEFGKKRPNYDVAFVYYAGHGVQISNKNYLLPTKQNFTSEDEVELFGVSVQDIMKYLRSQTDQVNILILDACRDNPFESNWNSTRSLKGGGLAKIPPPTGSLIAFSTDSGQTAPDGEGLNSIYTLSLSSNMMLEQTSIDQVFRNVRAEVLNETNGKQRPVEATQLTGESFYLIKRKFDLELKQSERLLNEGKFKEAIILLESIYKTDSNDLDIVSSLAKAYTDKASSYANDYKYYQISKKEFVKAQKLLDKYIPTTINDAILNKKVNTSQKMAYLFYRKSRNLYLSGYNLITNEYNISAIDWNQIFYNIEMSIKYDSLNPYWDYYLATIYRDQYNKGSDNENQKKSQEIYSKAIEKYLNKIKDEKNNAELFYYLSFCYFNTEKIDLGFFNLEKAVELEPDNLYYLDWLANKYFLSKNYSKVIEVYSKALNICNDCPYYYSNRAIVHQKNGNYKKAIDDFSIYYKIADREQDRNLRQDRGMSFLKLAKDNSEKPELSIDNYNNAIKDFDFSINYLLKSNALDKVEDLYDEYEKESDIEFISELISYRAKAFFEVAELKFYIDDNDYLQTLDASQNNYKILIDKGFFGDENEFIEQFLRTDYLKGEFKEAIKKGKNIILKHEFDSNQLASIYGFIGMTFWTLNDNKNSEIYYKKALDLVPSAENFNQYAIALFENGNYEQALFCFNKSIELEPNEEIHWNNRAEFYFKTKDFRRAESDIKKAISINEYFSLDSNLLLIKIKVEQKDFEGQIYYANNIIEYMSDDLRPYYWLSEIYLNQKRYIKSIINLSKVIDLFKKNNDSYQNKILYPPLVSYNDHGNTISDNYIEIELIDVFLKRAELFKLIGNDIEACEDLDKAFELDSQNELIKEKMNEICN